jgi:hypothetical protein
MAIDLLFLKPGIALSPFQLLQICQILHIHIPVIQGQITGILKMIEIYENNYQAIINSQTSQKLKKESSLF